MLRRIRYWSRLRVLVALSVVLAVVVACGQNDDEAPGSPKPSAESKYSNCHVAHAPVIEDKAVIALIRSLLDQKRSGHFGDSWKVYASRVGSPSDPESHQGIALAFDVNSSAGVLLFRYAQGRTVPCFWHRQASIELPVGEELGTLHANDPVRKKKAKYKLEADGTALVLLVGIPPYEGPDERFRLNLLD